MHRGTNLILLALAAWVVASCSASETSKPWNYVTDDNAEGPGTWNDNFPECGNSKNSPIDIPTDKMELDGKKIETWDLVNWNAEQDWTVLNENYTVKFSLQGSPMMTTSGGGLASKFEVLQFHLHWGASNEKGSEHKLGGKQFPMEMHFVHKNTDFATIEEAIATGNADALAAVGFFFELQDLDNSDFDVIVQAVARVRQEANYTTPDYKVNVVDFVAEAMKGNYFRYFGGLTTPGCQEIVEWTVFETPIGISANQMETIRTQTSNEKGVDFFREVQPIGSREVTIYDVDYDAKDYPDLDGAGPFTKAMWSITFLSLVITKFM